MSFRVDGQATEGNAAKRATEKPLAQRTANAQFKRLRPIGGPATVSDAYDVQQKYEAFLHGEYGNIPGYKIGLASLPIQAFFAESVIPLPVWRQRYGVRTSGLLHRIRHCSREYGGSESP